MLFSLLDRGSGFWLAVDALALFFCFNMRRTPRRNLGQFTGNWPKSQGGGLTVVG
jgi:hypothetical protein